MFNIEKDWTIRETSGTSRQAPVFPQSRDKRRQRTLCEAWGNSEKKSREAASGDATGMVTECDILPADDAALETSYYG